MSNVSFYQPRCSVCLGRGCPVCEGMRVEFLQEQVSTARALECIDALDLAAEMGLKQVPNDMVELVKRVLHWSDEDRIRLQRNDAQLSESGKPRPTRMAFLELRS